MKKYITNNEKSALFFCFVLFIFIYFGISNLGQSANIDEPLWTYERIPKYWEKIADRDLAKTMVSDKPGVTVALVSGIALTQVDPKEYRTKKEAGFIVRPEKDLVRFNFIYRLPILIFAALCGLLFYFFTSKLLNHSTAALSSIFIFLSPLLLGISRVINPDSLLWIFTPLSVICFLISLKTENRKYAALSGVFFGLSLLTKYISNILFIYYLAALIIAGLSGIVPNLKKGLQNYFIACGTAVAVFFLLLPAAWINWSLILEATVFSQAFNDYWPYFLLTLGIITIETYFMGNKLTEKFASLLNADKKPLLVLFGGIFFIFVIFSLLNVFSGMKWVDFESAMASPKTFHGAANGLQLFAANFYSFAFGISPLILLSFLGSFIFLLNKKIDRWQIFTFSSLLVFVLIYYFASAANKVSATIRYQIVVFPLLFITAAGLINLALDKFFRKKNFLIVFFSAAVLLLTLEIILIKPFYFSYASPLLPKKYILNAKDMGDGSYEAAQRLNQIPEAKNFTVWSDKSGVCFFFVGRCYSDMDFNDPLKFDYFVVSSGRESKITRLISSRMENGIEYDINPAELYSDPNPFWKLEIGSRLNNYVKIISADKFKP